MNKQQQRKLIEEMMRKDEEEGLYEIERMLNGWTRCYKCGSYHMKEVSYNGYCSEDCERNKDD